jgi:hypothetical protein
VALQSSREWKERGVRLWHYVAELVAASTTPPVPNPFTINFQVLQELPPLEQALQVSVGAAYQQFVTCSSKRAGSCPWLTPSRWAQGLLWV